MPWCDRCNAHMMFETAPCKCERFLVWPEDGYTEDDAWEFWARSAEEAAKKWAEDSDAQGDYDIVRGNARKVTVRPEGGEPKRYLVHGEAQAVYYATATD